MRTNFVRNKLSSILMKRIISFLCLIFCINISVLAQQHTISVFAPTCSYSGETITITGTNLSGVTGVLIGGIPAASFNVVNNTTLQAVVGAGATGTITVQKTGFTNAVLSGFTFFPYPTITGITTDFGNYWSTNTTSPSAVFPNNSHNLLSFTYGGVTYSTGVNDAMLSNQNVIFTPGKFKALPTLINGNVPTPLPAQLYIVAASLIDGNLQQALVSHPNISSLNFENVLTDGINGLDLGTGYTNLPTSAVMNLSIYSIDSSKISDNEPDIVITQIAAPTLTNTDTYTFKDVNGNTVGNPTTVSMQQVSRLGSYQLDLFSVAAGLPWAQTVPSSVVNTTSTYNNTTRDIRFVAFRLSDFGINTSNYNLIKKLEIVPSGVSDVAFVAYNANAINIPPAVSINTASSSVICNTGGSASLKVNVIDAIGGTISYAWEVSTNNGTTWTTVNNGGIYTGATTDNLQISAATAGYQYRAVVSESGLTIQGVSPVFTITAVSATPLSGTLNPTATVNTCLNSNTQSLLSVAPSGGTGSYSYQWQSSITSGSGFTDIPGAIASAYIIPVNATGTKYYRVVITSGCLNNTSTQSTVTVSGNAITSVTPAARCTSGSVALGAVATGGTINWYATSSSATSLGSGSTYNTPSLNADSTFYVSTTTGSCVSVRVPVRATIASSINFNATNFNVTNASDVVVPNTSSISFYTNVLSPGNHTVYYRITGANAQSGSATVNVSGGMGTFVTPTLNTVGSNSLVIDSIGVLNTVGCARSVSSSNTFGFTTSSASPLPVELLYFDVYAGSGSDVVSQWATAQEAQSEWFVLQRQSGSGSWVDVARIAAAGHSQELRRYESRDENALPGINYYRLQQIDIDQHISYSTVRQILFKQGEPVIIVYPNPVRNILTIQSASMMNDIPYQLTDICGRVLKSGRFNEQVNLLSVENLFKGIYFLKIGEGAVQSFRIIRE